jgi:hypothetical protein
MKKRLVTIAIASTTFVCGTLLSFEPTGQRGVSLSIENAQARVGRPLTPVSVAGVARRQYRRGVYGNGYGYGYGAVGAGLAVGAATVAAATSPWAYPYTTDEHYDAYASSDPTYAGGYYASSPWGYYDCRIPHPWDCQPYSHIGWYH